MCRRWLCTALSRVRTRPAPRAFQLDTQNDPGWVNGPNDVRICGNDAGGNQSAVHPPDGGGRQFLRRFRRIQPSRARLRGRRRRSFAAQASADIRRSAGDPRSSLTTSAATRSPEQPFASTRRPSSPTPPRACDHCHHAGERPIRHEAGPRTIAHRRARLPLQHANARSATCRTRLDRRAHACRFREKIVTNGHPVHFNGSVPGPNAEGRAVALQARVGRKWRTFKQLRTDQDGQIPRPISVHPDRRPRPLRIPCAGQEPKRLSVRAWGFA